MSRLAAATRHPAQIAAWRGVSTARDTDDKREAFQFAALTVGDLVDTGEIDKADAFDDLVALGEAHNGLFRDRVDLEHVVSQAFLGLRALALRRVNDTSDQGRTDTPPTPIKWLDMSNWDNEPRPQREWAILDRVPNQQAGLFSGEGGTGKSIIEMMKDVAHVTGKDWFGSMPTIGPAWYIGAEDHENEIHIRFHDIAAHYGVTFDELIEGGLKVLCLLGQDATLCAATGKSGKVETTALYRQLYEAAGDLKPKNISVDTLSRAFAGNEIDRVQVYGFAAHMQALAMVADGSLTILSHPSLQGIASGSGISGSTAFHGAFRFRQYLKTPKSTDDESDTDIRELEFKKNQYGPRGASIAVRYRNGVFVPVGSIAPLAQIAEEAKVDQVFLDCLDAVTAQGRDVYPKPGNGYAPTVFAALPQARGVGVLALGRAQERLFAAGSIHVVPFGSPSRNSKRIERKPPPEATS